MKTITALLLLLAFPIQAAADCVPGAAWCSGNYTYDGSGNIVRIGADSYQYDTVSRVVSGTADYQRTEIFSRQNYAYDAYGNRTSASRDAGSTVCDVTCELNRTIATQTNRISGATYDTAGNLISIQDVVNGVTFTATYEYDGIGSMTHAVANNDDRQFVYTADDERVAVRQGPSWTWTIRGLDNHVLREFSSVESSGLPTANFQWVKDYVYRDGPLLASKTAGSTTAYHFHLDHLGTPRVISNDNASIVAVHAYYPFGSELTLTPRESTAELLKFTGHERDLIGGDPHTLDDMHARYYSANLGRFLSVDPFVDLKTTLPKPQMWNRYAYVANDPMSYTDPNGKNAAVVVVAGGAAAATLLVLSAYVMAPNATDHNKTNGEVMVQGLRAAITAAAAAIGAVASSERKKWDRSFIIGETMTRVYEAAPQVPAEPFSGIRGDVDDGVTDSVLAVEAAIVTGARIFDIGFDPSRPNRSRAYLAETKTLEANGFHRTFSKIVMVQGKATIVWEWKKRI